MATPEFLTLPEGQLAYQRSRGKANSPGILFLGGFASDMTGTKATYIAGLCAETGNSCLRFDYSGHGATGGDFKQGTIGGWFRECCAVFEKCTEGPQIIIGSSMGGWLALLLARKYPDRVKALIGIAAAPDFTEDLMWLRMSADQKKEIQENGFILDPTAPPGEQAPITLRLIEEARQHLLLSKKIEISCPVRLLQGTSDSEVPWQHALRILENITTDDVRLTLVKDGDHRLSKPADLELLGQTVREFL